MNYRDSNDVGFKTIKLKDKKRHLKLKYDSEEKNKSFGKEKLVVEDEN